MPDNFIDMAITSPPYNVGIDYGGGSDLDHVPISNYYEFANSIMRSLFRITKDGGRICFEIGGSGRNTPMSWVWQDSAYKNGWSLFSEIVIEHRKTNACAWGSWMKADNVYTIPNFHLLYVFYKTTSTKRGEATEITSEQFSEWTRGRWQINWQGHKGHPASFPKQLPKRCLALFGHKGDVVYDPMCGSGTTWVACIETKRDFIGSEISREYCDIANERLKPYLQQTTLL